MINLENGRWVWLFYYAFFFLVWGIELIRVFKVKTWKIIPISGLVVTIITPIYNLIFAMGRNTPSEFGYLFQELQNGNIHAWIGAALYVLTIILLIWSLILPSKFQNSHGL